MNEYIEWVINHPVQAFFILLVEYIVIMLLSQQKRSAKIAKAATPFFILQNCIFNLTVLTVLFLDAPRELLVTSRLKRWKATRRHGIMHRARVEFAFWLCDILNRYDEGHC